MSPYESPSPREPEPTPEPTNEELDEAMKSVARQFGEDFESYADIVHRMEKENWRLVDVVTNAARVNAEESPDKEIKIIGQGTKFLIFERDKDNHS